MQLTDYISTGYFITVPTNRPDFVDGTLMPQSFLSLSSCFSDFFPGAWILEWCGTGETERTRIATLLGITPEQQQLAMAELDEALDETFGWENVIFDLDTARQYRQRYFSPTSRAKIVGAALHRDLCAEFVKVGTPPQPRPGESSVASHGTVHAVRRNVPPAAGGTILGFEPMTFDQQQLGCSWLCNGLERICADKLHVVPNSRGYIDDEESAARCIDLIEADETGAEPGLWMPWLLIEYPDPC